MAIFNRGMEGSSGLARRTPRVIGTALLTFVVLVVFLGLAGTIGSGNVGVRTTLGVISPAEIAPGIYLKWPIISTVEEFSAKEIAIDLNDLTPKAKDNLSLRDFDVTVYYRVKDSAVAELQTKYAGQSVQAPEGGYFLPAFELVFRVARNVAYEEIARVDSLVMHTRRDQLADAIKTNMQVELEKADQGVFGVTRVVIRSVMTDPSIEEAIRAAVANQKKLEAMAVQTEIAKKEAEIRVTEADGIARSNRIIAGSLTREYLQHEANQALLKFAEKGNTNTVVIPAGTNIAPMLNVGPPAK
jgi:regulator of protease activity HflC (stomatin/prohibitin superfamily)